MTVATVDPVPTQAFTSKERSEAGKLGLRCEAGSPEALQLLQSLMDDVVLPAWPANEQKRPSSVADSTKALGAMLADLLKLEFEGRAGSFGASPADFNGLPFGRRAFMRVRNSLDAAGFLAVQLGFQQLINFKNHSTGQMGKPRSHGGQVSRFRLTAAVLERVGAAGVDLQDWAAHWKRAVPTKLVKASTVPVLVLRAKAERVYGVRKPGKDLVVDFAEPEAAAIVKDLQDHNAFVMAAGVGGVAFVGLRRVFSDGGQPGAVWRRGGRFYSIPGGEQYEALSGDERRASITLGGHPVGEADIRASHLSILYALEGLQLDPGAADPYTIEGLDRDVVKLWVAQSLGRNTVTGKQWSSKARKRFASIAPGKVLSKVHPITAVRDAVLAVHPVLGELGRPGAPNFLDLHFHESEVLRMAMAALRREGIASLPVHDSLLVPVTALQVAARTMDKAFRDYMEGVTGSSCAVRLSVQLKEPAAPPPL